MKINYLKVTLTVLISVACAPFALAQGFVNLDFEDATITPVSGFPGFVIASNAIPGWTAYTFGNPMSRIFYNDVSLGAPAVSLQGPGSVEPIIQGNYTVILQGAFSGPPGNSAAIGQTGQIPETAQSLVFWGFVGLDNVSFDGQTLSLVVIGSTANYNIYGADISSFAGQTGQLLFTAPPGFEDLVDNIQFSPSPVPEPTVFALSALAATVFAFRRW